MSSVHKFEQNGIKMVLDGNSGSFHIVDGLVYQMLDYYKDYSLEKIKEIMGSEYDSLNISEAYEELKSLEDMGQLFSEDPYLALNIDRGKSYIKAMCLNIAHDCNLRCKYCFASKGDYKGKRCLMSEEVGKKAIDFVIEKSGPRKNIEIDLFGGEPLMNFKAVKSIVEYGNEKGPASGKNIRFTMTTNATLLNDEIMDFLNKNMVNIVLSIDGRKSVNDNVRVRCDGSGTYDDILPKIKRMVQKRDKGKQYYARGTFTSKNIDFYNDVVALADEGFDEISIEPVVLPDDNELSIKKEHIDAIFEQYDKLSRYIIERRKSGRPIKFYHFNIDVNGGPCVYKRVSGCGAGFEYIAVTPEGDIYPCHQFVGNEKFKMGTVFEGILNNDISAYFKNGHIYNKPDCKDCWAKFYCSGGCQANNYNFNGTILKPYGIGCILQRKRIECALMIKAAESLEKQQ